VCTTANATLLGSPRISDGITEPIKKQGTVLELVSRRLALMSSHEALYLGVQSLMLHS